MSTKMMIFNSFSVTNYTILAQCPKENKFFATIGRRIAKQLHSDYRRDAWKWYKSVIQADGKDRCGLQSASSKVASKILH